MINRRRRGFTLVELLTVVTIVAILAAIAIPSYREYIRRANRSEAKAALLEDAQYMERMRAVNNRYDLDGTKEGLPVKQAPRDGTAQYTIDLLDTAAADLSENKFTLVATPTAGMTTDKCGSFTLTEAGAKGLTGNSTSVAVADCWNR